MKTFSTITLRNLDSDESKDVIEILNDFMNESDIKTGQAAIEGIIRKYYKILKLSKDLQTTKNNLEKELADTKRDWQAESKSLTTSLNTFGIFMADIAALQNGVSALQELQKSRNPTPTPTPPKPSYSSSYNHYNKVNPPDDDDDEEEDEEYEEEEDEEEEE